jgi:hypothetical protein
LVRWASCRFSDAHFEQKKSPPGRPVVVISNELWRRLFHEDISVVGATVTIDGVPHTVVGVVPPNRQYPTEADLWRPLTAREREESDRELVMIARLRDNVPLSRANAELATLAGAASGGARTGWADEVQRTDVKNVRAALNVLFASTLVVLLVVCANVAALMGARASDRAREMAVRGALGASRRHLFLQLTTEGFVTAMAGGLAGLLLGRIALRVLVAIAPVSVPRLPEIAMDTPVFAASLTVAMLIGLCAGLGPAVRLSRSAESGALRPAGWNRATETSRTRRLLVLAQVALAVMLTIGAGLLVRSLRNLVSVNNGFDVDHIVAVDLDLRGSRTGDPRLLFHALVAAAETLPGVRAAAVSLLLPTQLAGLRAGARRRRFGSAIDGRTAADHVEILRHAGRPDHGRAHLRGHGYGDHALCCDRQRRVCSRHSRRRRGAWHAAHDSTCGTSADGRRYCRRHQPCW